MNYDYTQIFAKEYSGYREISVAMEDAFKTLCGRLLTGWHSSSHDGIYYLDFGSSSLIIWYRDSNHCKITFGTKGLPALREELKPLPDESKFLKMELQDCYVLMGDEPKICLSLQDSFFEPNTETALQFILSSAQVHDAIQIARVPASKEYRRISVDRIPTTLFYKIVIQNTETEEYYTSIVDYEGSTLIPPIYNDIDLLSAEQSLFRIGMNKQTPGGEPYSLYGICDIHGHERIPCTYPDLYYMANGFTLVMDYRSKWWVLDEENNAIFGPHNNGVDIYSRNREYLYYIEYNSVAQCESLGIYSVSLRTILTPAEYIRIHYLGNDTFEAQKIYGVGDIRTVRINPYGVIQSEKE